MPSEIAGTAGLALLGLVALGMAASRTITRDQLQSAVPAGAVTLVIQALHAGEEWATGFPRRFPELLGLKPWSETFFIAFNLAWISLWAVALGVAARGRPHLVWHAALLFLALAACANGVAHPLLAVASGGYFPGLMTAVPLGVAGTMLARRLLDRSRRRAA